jgi:arsenate reductase-like glutaredoxin family protein
VIRVFGAKNCSKCESLISCLRVINIPYEFIDANADDTQELCDKYDVDALPHVQLLDDNQVIWQKAKDVNLPEILSQIKAQENETKRSTGKGG